MNHTRKPFALIVAALLVGAGLLAACSAENERALAPDYAKNAKAVKAQLEAMARDYGLCLVVNEDSLRQQMMNRTFSKDSMKQEFAMMSKMNGYYPFVTIKKNQVAFNSDEARLARFRRQLLPTRDVTSGKWLGTPQEATHNIALRYNLSWPQPATTTKSGRAVRLVSLNASDGFDGAYNNDMAYRFDRSGGGFAYHFTCNISRGLGTYVYSVKGNYRPEASWATVAAARSGSKAHAAK